MKPQHPLWLKVTGAFRDHSSETAPNRSRRRTVPNRANPAKILFDAGVEPRPSRRENATVRFALCGSIIVPGTLFAQILRTAEWRILLQHPLKVRRSRE